MLDQVSKTKDLFILGLALMGAILIFIYSISQNQDSLRVVNQPPEEIYQIQTKPEILFNEQSQLEISIIIPGEENNQ